MYYEHFGLSQAPFKITPNTDFFFSGGNRGPVLDALVYAIMRGEGIVKVTGEVGSGKTMLCNMLQNRLPENVESVYLANPSVGPEEVLHAIAFELQLGLDRHADRLEVMHALQDYLVSRYAEDQRVVVFIEESQSMPLATLEEIRLLSNLETRNDKLLQIVLFGQPELDENLRRQDIRQLRDRITHSFRLQPLTCEEVREYLMFRMRAAGYRGPELFSTQVVKKIARASSGLTRRINLVADKALLAAFSENTHAIEPRHIEAALRDSEFSQPAGRWSLKSIPPFAWGAASLLVGAALGAGVYSALGGFQPAPAETAHVTSPEAEPAAAGPAVTPRGAAQAPHRTNTSEATRNAAPTAVLASAAVTSVVDAPVPRPQPMSGRGVAAASADDDVIARRMEATRKWISSRTSRTYSIQLFVAEDEEQLRNTLRSLTKFVELDDVYVYRSSGGGRQMMSVLWGSFPDRKAAQRELAQLPPVLRANRPYLRTSGGVRAEIEGSGDRVRRSAVNGA
jgi:type II secretory pathway predicted ATPase ExeA